MIVRKFFSWLKKKPLVEVLPFNQNPRPTYQRPPAPTPPPPPPLPRLGRTWTQGQPMPREGSLAEAYLAHKNFLMGEIK